MTGRFSPNTSLVPVLDNLLGDIESVYSFFFVSTIYDVLGSLLHLDQSGSHR